MRRWLLGGLVVATIAVGAVRLGLAQKPGEAKPNLGKLRHIVLFKFKDGAAAQDIKKIEDSFRTLPTKVPQIIDFEWGTDVSVENLSQGFTHCFVVTFQDADGRAVYLPHPAHQEFVELMRPHLDKVLVIDYVAKE